MDTFNLILVAVAGLVLGLGLVSGVLRRTALSDPLVSMVAGILLGPQALGVLEPDALGDRAFVLEQAARLTLAVGLMGIALSRGATFGAMLARWPSCWARSCC